MSSRSQQNQNSDLPQLEEGDSGEQSPAKIPYGQGLEARLNASATALWNKLQEWGLLLPEQVRTTPMSEIRKEVRRILPQGLTVHKYASRLMEQLWRSRRLPVQLIPFRRYPRSRDVDYQIIYALRIHFGEENLPDVTQRVRPDVTKASTSLKLGRKALPADFVELFTRIYQLDMAQRERIRQWAQEWPLGQSEEGEVCPYLMLFLRRRPERFVTGHMLDSFLLLEPCPFDLTDPFAQSDFVPLDDLWDEAPGMSILDDWSPNLGDWVRLEDVDYFDYLFTFE